MVKKKKKTAKQIPVLSPENYIRQKSRNLPLGECFISKNWKADSLTTIFITRKHMNGNVTLCMYLVDLACLGIKDTDFKFNMPSDEIEKICKESKDHHVELIKTSYELVHNIISAGLQFAEKYGFKPCKDFTAVTRYFLEEDTDDIPLIQIACGERDGKPLYINTGFDSPAREQQIITQLEKTAGKGNYHVMLKADIEEDYFSNIEDFDEDEDDFDEDDEIIKEICQLNGEEQKSLWVDLTHKSIAQNSLSDDDIKRLAVLSNCISYVIASDEAIDECLAIYEEKFKHEIVGESEFPNSFYAGIQNRDGETVAGLCFNVLYAIMYDEKPKQAIAIFQKEVGEIPAVEFLELFHLNHKGSKKFRKKMEESFRKYPDYFLIKIYQQTLNENVQIVDTEILDKILSDEKQPITHYEAELFFSVYAFHLSMNQHTELAAILAFEEYVLNNLDFLSDKSFVGIVAMTRIAKIQRIVKYFQQAEELNPPTHNPQ